MDINPIEQIQSISDFRTKTEEILKSLNKKKTVLLTQHGKTRAILVDPQAYQRQLDRLLLAEKIIRAEQEIEQGKSLRHSEVEKLSQTWIK